MALQLNEEQPSGISGDYWKVSRIQILEDNKGCVVRVALFKDAASRTSDKAPICFKEYLFEDVCRVEDFVNAGDTPAKLVYDHLKTLPEFSGAVDV